MQLLIALVAYGHRIRSTGTGAMWTTPSATLPRTSRAMPMRPWVPVTMRSASQRREVLRTVQRGLGKQNAIGQHLVNPAGERIAGEVAPFGSGRGQGPAETNQRARPRRIELARETLADFVGRLPSREKRGDRRDERLTADHLRHRRGRLWLQVHCCTNPFPVGNRFSPASIAVARRFSGGGNGHVVYGE